MDRDSDGVVTPIEVLEFIDAFNGPESQDAAGLRLLIPGILSACSVSNFTRASYGCFFEKAEALAGKIYARVSEFPTFGEVTYRRNRAIAMGFQILDTDHPMLPNFVSKPTGTIGATVAMTGITEADLLGDKEMQNTIVRGFSEAVGILPRSVKIAQIGNHESWKDSSRWVDSAYFIQLDDAFVCNPVTSNVGGCTVPVHFGEVDPVEGRTEGAQCSEDEEPENNQPSDNASSGCKDDADGLVANQGLDCGTLKALVTCDGDIHTLAPALVPTGTFLKLLCPNTCDNCPGECR